MAVRRVIGFEHLPKNVSTWQSYADDGILQFPKAANLRYTIIAANGQLSSQTTGSANDTVGMFYPGRFVDPTCTKYWIGFRVTLLSGFTAGSTGAAVTGLEGSTDPEANPSRPTLNMLRAGEIPNAVPGGNYYIEMEFDVATGSVSFYIDNKFLKTVAVTDATLLAMVKGRSPIVWLFCSRALTQVYTFRDIYVSDNVATADDANVTRLGPQTVVPLSLSGAAGTGWTSAGASLQADLDVVITNASALGVLSPVPSTDLELSVAGDISGTKKINAIQIGCTPLRSFGNDTKLSAKLSRGSDNTASRTISLSQFAFTYGTGMGVFTKAPSGGDWTLSELLSSKIKFTPL